MVHKADGKAVTHHVTYELALPDGRVLRTRVSRPPNKTTYGAKLWGHILDEQLCVSEEELWACVRDDRLPDRGAPSVPEGETLPADLVHLLVTRLKLTETEIGRLSKKEALQRMRDFWTQGG